ncbi:MAG: type II secretion system protein GspL [Candidatus Endonucleobacter bathymodioli]|uniref:Type II secretion system protein GspL n=1 Tax=Candidatus Endonucleibacter bathymodioli TaxID=539814 RepID=A0AA90SM72_9GAMM|nr:type II secretion system protein GspL [Candidatus Endonucleobacter bathymodioli]
MKDILLVRILPDTASLDLGCKVQWGIFSEAGELSGEVRVSELGQLKNEWCMLKEGVGIDTKINADKKNDTDKIILLLPGNLTVNRQLVLTKGQKKHIVTALPYLIEEDLAVDVENVHFASVLHRKEDTVSLIAISHESIQTILAIFDEACLPPDQIYSECQLVNSVPETISLVLDSSTVMMARPGYATQALEYETVPFALNQRTATLEDTTVEIEQISQVVLLSPNAPLSSSVEQNEALKDELRSQGWFFQEETLGKDSVFEFLAEAYFKLSRVYLLADLRHGPYQSLRKTSLMVKRWRPIAIVAACWLVIGLSVIIGQGIYFDKQADQLWNQNAALYLKGFPQDRQVIDAKARNQRSFNIQKWLERRLNSNKETKTADKPLLPLLQGVSAIVASQGKEAAIVPQGIEFSNDSGNLIFEFQAASLEAINKLMADLKEEGLQTRLDTANQGKVGAIARMTITR